MDLWSSITVNSDTGHIGEKEKLNPGFKLKKKTSTITETLNCNKTNGNFFKNGLFNNDFCKKISNLVLWIAKPPADMTVLLDNAKFTALCYRNTVHIMISQ